MKSLSQLYKIGRGPSSSHSMGPAYAAEELRRRVPEADKITVILYGSLAKTGRGHHTDSAIISALPDIEVEILFDTVNTDIPHENTLDFIAFRGGAEIYRMRAMSVGGGDIEIEGESSPEPDNVYPENTFSEIASLCKSETIRISEYCFFYEPCIKEYLHGVWEAMKASISRGLSTSGVLEGGLNVERKAQFLYNQRHIDESQTTGENRIVCAYAFAVGEENAAGGIVATAPTCGASGVMPAALRYTQEKRGFSDDEIVRALAVGGIIGNIIKTNASISGAECGCQAEMGSACSMAAAALSELYGLGIDQIEYAAEVAMEHQLGLTCDPICGLVQIPCIERGAVAAMRAMNALSLANFLSNTRKISFDLVVRTMYETGRDIKASYRETSEGGLAKLYK